ncbi:hypothetical protein, partial [Bacillus subtilis]|uniref:hypothetical protein n=1 Tax=Bacillus subtilis TaxID=1423 RepID=UPI003C22A591
RKGVRSFLSSDVVHLDDVLARKSDVEATVARMHVVAGATAQDDVPFNRRSCRTWSGCPHQSICRAFQE